MSLCCRRLPKTFILLGAIVCFGGPALAQGVAFQVTSLPRIMRQDGMTEIAGEVVFKAMNDGTIAAGSTIDLIYSVPITNNTPSSTNNVNTANNAFCNGLVQGCPFTLTFIPPQTIQLFFASDTALTTNFQIAFAR